MVDQCDDDFKDVEYEEQPKTLWETQCEIVEGEECNLETVIKKKPLEETVCTTVPENKCETVIKMKNEEECTVEYVCDDSDNGDGDGSNGGNRNNNGNNG